MRVLKTARPACQLLASYQTLSRHTVQQIHKIHHAARSRAASSPTRDCGVRESPGVYSYVQVTQLRHAHRDATEGYHVPPLLRRNARCQRQKAHHARATTLRPTCAARTYYCASHPHTPLLHNKLRVLVLTRLFLFLTTKNYSRFPFQFHLLFVTVRVPPSKTLSSRTVGEKTPTARSSSSSGDYYLLVRKHTRERCMHKSVAQVNA